MSYDDDDNKILDTTRESCFVCIGSVGPLLISDKPSVLAAMMDYFGNLSFMCYHAQLFYTNVLADAFCLKKGISNVLHVPFHSLWCPMTPTPYQVTRYIR